MLCLAALLIGQDRPETEWRGFDGEKWTPSAEWVVDRDTGDECDCRRLFDSTSTEPVYEYDPDKGWILVWGEGAPIKPVEP